VDGAQGVDETTEGAGMSAPENGQGAASGPKFDPKSPVMSPVIPSFEMSTRNNPISGGCADLS
jgi:hypothetical protein